MALHPLPTVDQVAGLSLLCLNARGQFVEPHNDLEKFTDGDVIAPAHLPDFFKRKVYLPKDVTDVFVWVHGWRYTHADALATGRQLFNGLQLVYGRQSSRYPKLGRFNPAFLIVRWPSMSAPEMHGYKTMRDRAAALTERGEAEFFLASLLGYLDQQNQPRSGGPASKTLVAAGGFFVHCIGHSFGGRFLTAAIRAAADPRPRTLSLLGGVAVGPRRVLGGLGSGNGFQFTVDSLLVFQMAAPHAKFGPRLEELVRKAPLRGPIVLTFSSHDHATCRFHWLAEWESGIGCVGATQPAEDIVTIPFGDLNTDYSKAFTERIVNVNAGDAFTHGPRISGAHSDFYYEESIHLALSLVNYVH